jgi:hypothetical protein
VSSENGSILLDRPGIFKARPFDWSVQPSATSKAIAISIGLLIEAQYENGEWTSWAEYEPHQVRGWWYVIGKNGQVNTVAVEQLAKSLGWNGDLKSIRAAEPPDVVVQITVKSEEFNGKVTHKAGWMNPGDHVPDAFGASDEDVQKLSVQFGSLLRAAAASVAKTTPKGPPKTTPKPAPKPSTPPPATPLPDDKEPVPF